MIKIIFPPVLSDRLGSPCAARASRTIASALTALVRIDNGCVTASVPPADCVAAPWGKNL
jgi:hypothetical protein